MCHAQIQNIKITAEIYRQVEKISEGYECFVIGQKIVTTTTDNNNNKK